MQKTKKTQGPGFFAKYGAAVALALSALIVISASAAFFMFTGAVQDEADAAASETVASFRDAIAYEAASRIGDLTETLAAATGYVETNGGAPGDEEVTAGLNAMGTPALSFSYESPDKLAGMSEYLGESRERLEEKLAGGGLAGILINYPNAAWDQSLFLARGVYRGGSLKGVVTCVSDASRLFAGTAGRASVRDVLLVTAEGYVLPATHDQLSWAGENGYNLFTAWQNAGMTERNLNALKRGLSESGAGVVGAGRTDAYLAFAPLGVNGWNVVATLDRGAAAVLDAKFAQASLYAGIAAFLLAAAVALLGILVYREAGRARRLRDARYTALSDFTDKIFFEYDLRRRELVFTPNVRRAIPSLASNVISLRDDKRSFHHVHPEDTDALRRVIRQAAAEPVEDFRVRVRVRNSQYETFSLRTALLSGTGGTVAVMGEMMNLAGQKNLSESLSSPENRDQLTGMPNYNGVRLRMERLIADNQGGALLIIDLNDFGGVNERYGKDEGDELLRRISRAVAKTFRRDDVVGRTGGDEFTVYMIGAEEYGIVAKKAEMLIENIEKIEGLTRDVHVTASVGIAFSPYDGATYEDLSRAANAAVSIVQKEKAAAYRFFSREDLPVRPGDEA